MSARLGTSVSLCSFPRVTLYTVVEKVRHARGEKAISQFGPSIHWIMDRQNCCACAHGVVIQQSQGLINPRSRERACNSAYACRDGKMLKIEPNAWVGGRGSCAVCVDLQAVGTLEFFGELYSLAKGFGPFLRGFGQALEKGKVYF